MPDLTLEYRYVCPSVLTWHKTVTGKSGTYEVSYGYQSTGDYEYGWSCTCPQFKFRKAECKHIKAVKHERCAWNEEAFCGGGAQHDDGKCPNCGDMLIAIKIGV
jgi:hypothetical protein